MGRRFSQIYTDNIIILQFKNLDDLCSPARSCPRQPRLAWLAGELAMAGGSMSKKGNSYTINLSPVAYRETFEKTLITHNQEE